MYVIVSLDIVLGISLYFIAILVAIVFAVKSKDEDKCGDSL